MRHDLNKAREIYRSHGLDFDEQKQWHEDEGWVICIPYAFGMGYFYQEDGKTVLHVSYVQGDMRELLRFSLKYDLDKIEFMRDFKGEVKSYNFDKFIKRIFRHG